MICKTIQHNAQTTALQVYYMLWLLPFIGSASSQMQPLLKPQAQTAATVNIWLQKSVDWLLPNQPCLSEQNCRAAVLIIYIYRQALHSGWKGAWVLKLKHLLGTCFSCNETAKKVKESRVRSTLMHYSKWLRCVMSGSGRYLSALMGRTYMASNQDGLIDDLQA